MHVPFRKKLRTDPFDKATICVRGISPDTQDEIARMVLAVVGDGTFLYRFTPEEAAEQRRADAEEARGDYATDAEVRATGPSPVFAFTSALHDGASLSMIRGPTSLAVGRREAIRFTGVGTLQTRPRIAT